MKIAVIIFGLLCTWVTADTDILYGRDSPLIKEVLRNYQKCIKLLNPDEKTLKYVLTMAEGHDDDKKVTCFYACMLEGLGLMTNARFNFARMSELMKAGHDKDHDIIDAAVQRVMDCQKEAETTDNACTVASNYSKCLRLSVRRT